MSVYRIIRERYANPAEFIARLKGRMRLEGVTQKQLAERSGYHQSVISRWFTENPAVRVDPGLRAMIDLDEAFDQLTGKSEL